MAAPLFEYLPIGSCSGTKTFWSRRGRYRGFVNFWLQAEIHSVYDVSVEGMVGDDSKKRDSFEDER